MYGNHLTKIRYVELGFLLNLFLPCFFYKMCLFYLKFKKNYLKARKIFCILGRVRLPKMHLLLLFLALCLFDFHGSHFAIVCEGLCWRLVLSRGPFSTRTFPFEIQKLWNRPDLALNFFSPFPWQPE